MQPGPAAALAMALGGALLLAGCAGPLPMAGPGRAVALRHLDCESRQGTELHRLVTTAAEWAQVWRQACGDGSVVGVAPAGDQAAPEVDFARESVAVSFWGQKPSGGFAARIANVTLSGDRAVVDVVRVSPGEDCATIAVVTYPHDVAVVAEPLIGPGQFRFQDQVADCA